MSAARPCTCDRVRIGKAFRPDLGECVRCWLYHHKEHVNRAWGGSGTVAAVTEPVPACAFRGDELSAEEVRRTCEPIPLRRWFVCDGPAGRAPRGLAVSGCTGCGPACKGYEAEADD